MISTLKLFREITDDCIYPDIPDIESGVDSYTMYSAFMKAFGIRFYGRHTPDDRTLLYFQNEQEQLSLFDIVSTHLSFMNVVMDGGKEAASLFDNLSTLERADVHNRLFYLSLLGVLDTFKIPFIRCGEFDQEMVNDNYDKYFKLAEAFSKTTAIAQHKDSPLAEAVSVIELFDQVFDTNSDQDEQLRHIHDVMLKHFWALPMPFYLGGTSNFDAEKATRIDLIRFAVFSGDQFLFAKSEYDGELQQHVNAVDYRKLNIGLNPLVMVMDEMHPITGKCMKAYNQFFQLFNYHDDFFIEERVLMQPTKDAVALLRENPNYTTAFWQMHLVLNGGVTL